MRRRTVVTSLLAITAVAGTVASLPASAATPVLNLAAIAGSAPALANAVDNGPAASRTEKVVLSLGLRNKAQLAQLIAAGTVLTPAQFAATYAPAQASVDAVTAWAKAAGLTVASVSSNRQLVTLTAPTAVLAKALGTSFDTFTAGTATYRSVTRAASLPASLSGLVVGITGLSDIQTMHVAQAKAASTLLPTFGPKDISTFYDAPSSAVGTGQTVGVLAEGDLTQVFKDLRTFEADFALPQAAYSVVGPGSADVAGADEYDLDTQYATSQAPGAALKVYNGASLADTDILDTTNLWVQDSAVKTASFSVGGCESLSLVTGFTTSEDQLLMQAAAQGQSLFVSSGDSGASCLNPAGNGIPAGVPGVEYPASSPYAVGVGGTTVVGENLGGLYSSEVAWYAGGGGIGLEPAPAWQTGVPGSLGLRGVPDVALDADPTTGYTVVVNGAEETIGGTSAGAPSWNGFWARALGAKGGVGFAGPKLYAASSTFHDVVLGTNVPYVAGPGYDLTTGLGTPDVAKLVAAV